MHDLVRVWVWVKGGGLRGTHRALLEAPRGGAVVVHVAPADVVLLGLGEVPGVALDLEHRLVAADNGVDDAVLLGLQRGHVAIPVGVLLNLPEVRHRARSVSVMRRARPLCAKQGRRGWYEAGIAEDRPGAGTRILFRLITILNILRHV